jgi:acyl-coenzyme A thioesterase PaaI-like protein
LNESFLFSPMPVHLGEYQCTVSQMRFDEKLKRQQFKPGEFQYQLDSELNGGFGGTNGGVLAAVCINAAQLICPERRPVGLDARFIRGFKPGLARVECNVLNQGRTLSTICVDIYNQENKLTTRGTVSLVVPDALAPVNTEASAPAMDNLLPYDEGRRWKQPPLQEIPLIETFNPRQLGRSDSGVATAVDTIWDEQGALAEACCIAADISVGPPVASALRGKTLATPNPDLALRFTGADYTPAWLVSICHLESIRNGLATTRLEVRDGQSLLAVGVSTTTCFDRA